MNANLVLLRKNGSHKTFALPRALTVIGRREDCDLRIPLPMVSRRHCVLRLNKDSLELRDLDSRGGTFVNDQRVESEVTVRPGDYIRVGPLIFVCQIDGVPKQIVPPKKAAPPPSKAAAKPKPKKAPPKSAPEDSGSKLDADLSDLDVSDSFINLDESDSDLEDLKNA
ncbi:MAG: FHA domain-containing protein [Planctomycetes bacterium]|jgi:pSer/pThr/pTyr-binding forkhead associated (FHA) protein|nr:FHA domain-containing protein [Planctomycetota bacterium]